MRPSVTPQPASAPSSVNWPWPILAGACAMLVGLGLARFAYTALLPALVSAGWFNGAEAAYLGAANLGGYLVGAIIAYRLAGSGAVPVLRSMMLLAGLSFLACAWPLSFWWIFLWRFLSGVAGAVIMVLAAPQVLKVVPAHRRGLAAGLVFAGVGAGIVVSGTLVPLLIAQNIETAWLTLGGVCLALTAGTWWLWPSAAASGVADTAPPAALEMSVRNVVTNAEVRPILIQYGLIAAALVPHMIFLVDYVARGLHQGLNAGALYWILFGIAAFAGPVLTGRLADLVGFRAAIRGGLAAHVICTAWLAASGSLVALVLSSLVAGAAVPGFTALALGRLRQVVTGQRQQIAWGRATFAFALMQAVAGFGCSVLFDWQGSYTLLFATGAAAALAALAVDLLWPRRRKPAGRRTAE